MSIMLHITYNYALQTLCGAPHNVCNDNGIAENLPLNRMLGDYDIIHGTFFVCGLTRDDFTDLTPQQMKHYEEMYHDPQLFFLLGKTLCVEHTTPEEYTRVMAPPPKTKESPERRYEYYHPSPQPACGLFRLSETIQQARRRTYERHF